MYSQRCGIPKKPACAADDSWYAGQYRNRRPAIAAIMVETAKRASVDCIVTRNQKDYAKSPVPVFSPGEFLEHLMSSNEEPLE